MNLPGRQVQEHICHMCQGKAAKRLFRTLNKRVKQREKRAWKKDQGL